MTIIITIMIIVKIINNNNNNNNNNKNINNNINNNNNNNNNDNNDNNNNNNNNKNNNNTSNHKNIIMDVIASFIRYFHLSIIAYHHQIALTALSMIELRKLMTSLDQLDSRSFVTRCLLPDGCLIDMKHKHHSCNYGNL